MVTVNQNYLKLPGSYLFSNIAKKVNAFSEANPDKKIIRLGIGVFLFIHQTHSFHAKKHGSITILSGISILERLLTGRVKAEHGVSFVIQMEAMVGKRYLIRKQLIC